MAELNMYKASFHIFGSFQQKLTKVLDRILRPLMHYLLQAFLNVDLKLFLDECTDAHLLHLHSSLLLFLRYTAVQLGSRILSFWSSLALLHFLILLLSFLHPIIIL